MSNPPRQSLAVRAGSRHWLLLALLLFVGGQTLAAEHRHGDLLNLHSDCSVCVLSAASGSAAVDSAWPDPIPALAAEYTDHATGRSRPAAVRFCDSRAPPRH